MKKHRKNNYLIDIIARECSRRRQLSRIKVGYRNVGQKSNFGSKIYLPPFLTQNFSLNCSLDTLLNYLGPCPKKKKDMEKNRL